MGSISAKGDLRLQLIGLLTRCCNWGFFLVGFIFAHRQAWGVGVLQEGLEHHSEVVLEETLAVQQLLQSPLKTEAT